MIQANLGPSAVAGQALEIIVGSTDADPGVRAIAVRKLFETLSKSDPDPTEKVSPEICPRKPPLTPQQSEIQAALLARLLDPSIPVLTALYANPSVTLTFLGDTYLGLITTLLNSATTSPSRHLVLTHLTFLIQHFIPAHPDLATKAITECLWPFLIFSKPRQKTVAAVWDLLEQETCSTEISTHDLLGGCLDAIRWEEGKVSTTSEENSSNANVDQMARVDLALANKLAENMLSSDAYASHFDVLLGKLGDTNSFSRSFGYLVMRALLGRLSGEHQVNAARRVLEAMELQSLEGMDEFKRGSENLQLVSRVLLFVVNRQFLSGYQFLQDLSLGTSLVLKPSSKTTLNRLKMAILAMIPTISRPVGVGIDWLGGAPQVMAFPPVSMPWFILKITQVNTTDTRGIQYVCLMRSIYRLANSSTSLPSISAHLLRAQFISLKDDSLAFLAGIWVSSLPPLSIKMDEDDDKYVYHQAALRHAAAFLVAHQSTQNWIDFQTILPLIVLALGSMNQGVRAAAMECIFILNRLGEAEKPVAIYGFDTIYGDNSGQPFPLFQLMGPSVDTGLILGEVQYLEWADLRKYVAAIVEHRHHLVTDATHIKAFHQQSLVRQKSDSKKDAAYVPPFLCASEMYELTSWQVQTQNHMLPAISRQWMPIACSQARAAPLT